MRVDGLFLWVCIGKKVNRIEEVEIRGGGVEDEGLVMGVIGEVVNGWWFLVEG